MCGIFGVHAPGVDVSRITFYGLFALQHRGQESSGIAVSDQQEIDYYTGQGLVNSTFTERIIRSLRGDIAIGHNRYSTSQKSDLRYAQPFVQKKEFALAHNGNLPSVTALVNFLTDKVEGINNHSDSELMAETIYWHICKGLSPEQAIHKSFPLFTGAFSVVALTKDALYAFRDAYGIRPLVLGKIEGGYVFASETCALDMVNAKFIREVQPGELVIVDQAGLRSQTIAAGQSKMDLFEFVYFARPDSIIMGRNVYQVRSNCGNALAKECPLDVDLIVPIPQTAEPVATAYAQARGIRFEKALVKNPYVHRTFIAPEQHMREQGVQMKLNPIPGVLAGKEVALVDDSIVRGTTSKQLVQMVREAGAKKVHLLISSPPVRYPDFYGINTPNADELIAVGKSVAEIRDWIGADSLHYLSLEALIEATELPRDSFCTSCFTKEYPIDLLERSAEVEPKQTHRTA